MPASQGQGHLCRALFAQLASRHQGGSLMLMVMVPPLTAKELCIIKDPPQTLHSTRAPNNAWHVVDIQEMCIQ